MMKMEALRKKGRIEDDCSPIVQQDKESQGSAQKREKRP
jgi:hypothetical protein